jgi:hypothetical protein
VNGSGYKILGFIVWRGAKWYVRRTYGHLIPSRRVGVGALAVASILVLAMAGRRMASSES